MFFKKQQVSNEKQASPFNSNECKSPAKPQLRHQRQCLFFTIAVLLVLVIFAVALGVGLGVGLKSDSSNSGSAPESAIPTNVTGVFNTSTSNTTGIWQPAVGDQWTIDISDTPIKNTSVNVPIYDIDLFGNDAATISSLKAAGRKVICYFSAGSYENWRPDANKFHNNTDIGAPLDGWPGEWWVNTKSENVRAIMNARLDMAKTKGCDAVDPDNIDAYDNDGGGLSLTQNDAIDYVRFLANASHSRGMAVGLKNGGGEDGILPSVVGEIQFVVNEQCVKYSECNTYSPMIQAGKPVFHIEYPDGAPNINTASIGGDCSGSGDAAASGFSGVLKKMGLDDWFIQCPNGLAITA